MAVVRTCANMGTDIAGYSPDTHCIESQLCHVADTTQVVQLACCLASALGRVTQCAGFGNLGCGAIGSRVKCCPRCTDVIIAVTTIRLSPSLLCKEGAEHLHNDGFRAMSQRHELTAVRGLLHRLQQPTTCQTGTTEKLGKPKLLTCHPEH